MRTLIIHPKVSVFLEGVSEVVKKELLECLADLQEGKSIGMPQSRPMPVILHGVHELRFRDSSGIYRFFYYLKSAKGILIFHAYHKKSRTMPDREIWLAKIRLREIL